MIVITGGAGFIGSALIWKLNTTGIDDILIVDHLGKNDKWKNLNNLRFKDYIDKSRFLHLLEKNKLKNRVKTIFHMGACSATTEKDADYLLENNYRYSVELVRWSIANKTRFIYASSAATYGDGSLGFSDNHQMIHRIRPLNPYGYSKQLFDRFILNEGLHNRVAGLKFFNVFGPNEYHKKEMRSVVHKFFPAAQAGKSIYLFKSHKRGYKHGMQKRDFIYIKDIVDIILFFMENRNQNGIFNAGTGEASSFKALATALYTAVGEKPKIRYRAMPTDLRNRYQYFTRADTQKLRAAGYTKAFMPLTEAVDDYVKNYLLQKDLYLGNSPQTT